MTFYQKTDRHPLKWLVALFIFLFAMGFTVDEVSGVNIPKTTSEDRGSEQPAPPVDQATDDDVDPSPTNPPPEIPEPMTLILVGAGLGALHFARRRKKA